MFDNDVDAAPIVLDDFMSEDVAAKLRNSRTLLTAAALEALNRADTERRALLASIELRTTSSQHPVEITGDIRRELRGYLDDWHGLIRGNGAESRRVFDLVLRDRIRFRPVERKDGPGYELTVPIAFDRLVVSVIPSLQVRVAPQCQPVGTRSQFG